MSIVHITYVIQLILILFISRIITMATELGEELTNCTICFERLNNPKTLQCLHTFCMGCLQSHLAAYLSQRRDLIHPPSLPCPTCREFTHIPDCGISGLRTDFKIAKIIEYLGNAEDKKLGCDVCKTVRTESKAVFYCRDCNKNLCQECIYRHKNTEVFDSHVVKELKNARNSRAVCKEHEDEMEATRYFCQSCETPICTLCAMTEHMLHNLTDLDSGKARNDRSKKIKVLTQKVTSNVKQIDAFLNKLQTFQENLKTSYETTGNLIRTRAEDIINQVRDQEKQLLENLQQQYHGKMTKIEAERENLKECKEKFELLNQTASSTLKEDTGEPFFETSSEIIRELKTALSVQFLNPDDFSEADANFNLTLPKEMPQLGQLSEQNISANLTFMSRIPIQLVSKITNGNLDWPSDVAVRAEGEIVVADTENYQLKLFDKAGNLKQVVAVGEIKPAGVAVTKVRTIVATDILDRCVKIFSEHGQLLFEFGQGVFDSPAGIAVNTYGEYIVSDVGNHSVTVHNSQGNILARLGGYGHSDITFDGPWYVATNDNNDIIVADMGNHCVKIFDYQLHLVSIIEEADTLFCPSGLDVDIQGNLLICDSGRNLVSMYTPDGHLIDHILTEDDGIENPHGISIKDSGQLVVSLCSNKSANKHEVRIYQLYE